MKKILVALTILLMAADLCARPVSPTQAEKVASTAARLFLFELKGEKTPIDADVQWMLQDVTEEVAVSNIYVYNYYMSTKEAGHLGFVVVSGDDIASPVLAFSMEGTLDKDNPTPAVRCQLQQYGRENLAKRFAQQLRALYTGTDYATHKPCTMVDKLVEELEHPELLLIKK